MLEGKVTQIITLDGCGEQKSIPKGTTHLR